MDKKFSLYKFGKRGHVLALAEKGELYLSPASDFSNESLSQGAFDNGELELHQKMPDGVTFSLFSKDGKPKGELKPIEVGPFVAGPAPEAYLFCLSYDYNKSLYNEFEADTCLIIEDADRFISQVCMALRKKLPGWQIDAGSVIYRGKEEFFTLDPVNQDVYYSKPESYSHQREIRIVCTTDDTNHEFIPFAVNVGSLLEYTHITGVEKPDHMIPTNDYVTAWSTPWPIN